MTIRDLTTGDAEAAASLSTELGYPTTASEMEKRIADRAGVSDMAGFAACVDGAVVGWLDVGVIRHLDGAPYCEICGLVVAASHRGAGIGRELVAYAEQWAAARGLSRILVRSQLKREDAHRFYRREGFVEWKRSAVFTKSLA